MTNSGIGVHGLQPARQSDGTESPGILPIEVGAAARYRGLPFAGRGSRLLLLEVIWHDGVDARVGAISFGSTQSHLSFDCRVRGGDHDLLRSNLIRKKVADSQSDSLCVEFTQHRGRNAMLHQLRRWREVLLLAESRRKVGLRWTPTYIRATRSASGAIRSMDAGQRRHAVFKTSSRRPAVSSSRSNRAVTPNPVILPADIRALSRLPAIPPRSCGTG